MKKMNSLLKKAAVMLLILALAFMIMPQQSFAQENPQFFVVVDFMKVKQGDEGKYIDLEKNFWKPIHEERIKQGEIVGWVLYQVHYAGSEDAYNFATAAIFTDPSKLEHTFQVDPKVVHPDTDLEMLFNETMKSRELVHKQLLYRIDAVYPANWTQDFKYIQVNMMKVKSGGEESYVKTEQDLWRPVHKQLVDDGSREGWSLWSCVYPMGTGMDYDFVTVDYFKDFSKLAAADFMGAFKKVHPDKEVNMMMDETNKARKLVRAELWEVLDSAWKRE